MTDEAKKDDLAPVPPVSVVRVSSHDLARRGLREVEATEQIRAEEGTASKPEVWSMRAGIEQTLEKCIKDIIVAESPGPSFPGKQVFLVFADDTHFEFYGPNFSWTAGVDPGGVEKVRSYIAKFPGSKIIGECHSPDSRDSAAQEP